MADQARCIPRSVTLEPHLAALLPELVLAIGPAELAMLAAHAMRPEAAADGRPGSPARARGQRARAGGA